MQVDSRPAGTRSAFWLPVVLLLLTLVTTSAAGATLAAGFHADRALLVEDLLGLFLWYQNPRLLLDGLSFSFTLVFILLAHELGHYLTCRYYGIDASPPYFLPCPTLIGTLGAFIRIRGPIVNRRQLFDVGISGPIAGFVFIVPALAIGLAYSKVIPGIERDGDFTFGTPLLQRLLELLIFPGVPPSDIQLHPMARAAWAGLLATALNLLPIGQLDGGHILYAFVGARHKVLTNLFLLALIPLAIVYSPAWWVWTALLFFLGRKHPRIYDDTRLDPARRKLGWLALLILVLCFSPSVVAVR